MQIMFPCWEYLLSISRCKGFLKAEFCPKYNTSHIKNGKAQHNVRHFTFYVTVRFYCT